MVKLKGPVHLDRPPEKLLSRLEDVMLFNFRDLASVVKQPIKLKMAFSADSQVEIEEETHKELSTQLQSHCIFRTACFSRGPVDAEYVSLPLAPLPPFSTLFRILTCFLFLKSEVKKIIWFLRDTVGVRTIIDFRNKDEKEADSFDSIVDEYYTKVCKVFFYF